MLNLFEKMREMRRKILIFPLKGPTEKKSGVLREGGQFEQEGIYG
jgi:hypothetical protein